MENNQPDDIRSLRNLVKEITEPVHDHDKQLAVLETRVDSNEERLTRTESDVRDTKAMVQLILDRFADRTERENKDHKKFLVGAVFTLLTALGSSIYLIIDLVLKPRLGH